MPIHPGHDPQTGAVYLDPRAGGRALRVTWHTERTDADGEAAPIVVLSLWRDNVCSGSFRLTAAEVPGLIALLAGGLDAVERRADAVRRGAAGAHRGGHAATG